MKPDELDFRLLLNHYEVMVTRDNGQKGTAFCPFHNDKNKPGLSIDFSRNLYHCFTCGAGGSIVGFVMMKEDINYGSAIEWINKFYSSNLDPVRRVYNSKIDWISYQRKKNPMKYIFYEFSVDLEFFCWVIESNWKERCFKHQHFKMLEICHEAFRPDLYFNYWDKEIDNLITEKYLIGDIKHFSYNLVQNAFNSLKQENQNKIIKARNNLVSWLAILKKIKKDGVISNVPLILDGIG